MLLFPLAISIPDLYYVPTSYEDLNHYFNEMHIVQSCNNVFSLFKYYSVDPILSNHKGNYIYDIFQWIISKSGNYGLLAFFSVFVIYLCILLPIFHQFINYKCDLKQLFIGALIVISLFSYYNSSSTIRWYMASAIFVFLSYISCNCKHPTYVIPFLILLIFIHQGMIFPVTVAIFCIMIRNIKVKFWYYILFEVIFILIIYIINKFGFNNSIFNKFKVYSSSGFLQIFSWNKYALLSLVGMFLISYAYIYMGLLIIRSNINIDFSLELKMLVTFSIIDLTLLPSIIISNRYSMFVGMVGYLIYLKTIKHSGQIPNKFKILYIILSVLYILLINSAVLGMDFNFSQMNFNGIVNIISQQ